MSRKTIRKVEKIFSQEDVTGVKKDPASGLYKIVTQVVTREQNSGEIKCNKVVESDELYRLCSEDEAEKVFRYEDINGSMMSVFLAKETQATEKE